MLSDQRAQKEVGEGRGPPRRSAQERPMMAEAKAPSGVEGSGLRGSGGWRARSSRMLAPRSVAVVPIRAKYCRVS